MVSVRSVLIRRFLVEKFLLQLTRDRRVLVAHVSSALAFYLLTSGKIFSSSKLNKLVIELV
jgi:hypothetical protein